MSPEDEFKVLKDFISDIQKNILSLLPRTNNSSDDGIVTTSCATNDVAYAAATNIRGVEWMCADLVYILNTIDMSISSQNSIDREYLLCKLMDVPNHHSPAEFPLGSHNLNQLLQIIFNLKLLAPDREGERVGRYTGYMFHFTRSKNKENDAMVNGTQGTINLLTSYECLTQIEKDCLSCFSVFPRDSLVVKRRVLIHWWVGEGFIDLNPNSNPGTSMKSCSTTNDVNQVSLQVNASASRPSVMDIGNQMLKVLEEKGFIEPVMKKGRESGFCHMQPSVHSFVTAQAREGGFFDFDQNGQLKSCFSRSKRACLLTSLDNIPSSYSLWAKYTHFPKRLKSFKTVRTLFNVNEAVIDINKEWFSRMKYLSVLHLGGWHPEKPVVIDVVDPSFLKELKNMKQLRLLNLQGLSPITKLPDSISKLIDLRILDLRGCSYLEELPADIGSLKNLIHLDTTDCRFLSKLPKGIRLLSKLEVLKGFIITHEDSSRQNRKLFILEDLLNLRKLSKLILIVKVDGFPDSQDLLVLKGIKNLCKLNITWEIMTFTKQERRPMIDQEAPKGCVCLKRSCKAHRLHQNHKEETSTIHNQSNLRKLVLYNFPHETAPSLLDPSKWKKLEELHISGGSMTLPAMLKAYGENNWLILNYLDLPKVVEKKIYVLNEKEEVLTFPIWFEDFSEGCGACGCKTHLFDDCPSRWPFLKQVGAPVMEAGPMDRGEEADGAGGSGKSDWVKIVSKKAKGDVPLRIGHSKQSVFKLFGASRVFSSDSSSKSDVQQLAGTSVASPEPLPTWSAIAVKVAPVSLSQQLAGTSVPGQISPPDDDKRSPTVSWILKTALSFLIMTRILSIMRQSRRWTALM